MSESKEIVLPVSEELIPILFTDKQHVVQVIEEIRKLATQVEPDLATPKSRQAIASMAYRVTRSKTYLDGIGKEQVNDLRVKIDYVNTMRRLLCSSLDEIRDEVRKPLTDWEEAEMARLAELSELFMRIDTLDVHPGDSSDVVREKIAALEELFQLSYQEREEEAFEKLNRKKEQFNQFLNMVLHTEELKRVNEQLLREVQRNREAQEAQMPVVTPEPAPEPAPAPVYDPEPEPKPVNMSDLMIKLKSVAVSNNGRIELNQREAAAIIQYIDSLEAQCNTLAIVPLNR